MLTHPPQTEAPPPRRMLVLAFEQGRADFETYADKDYFRFGDFLPRPEGRCPYNLGSDLQKAWSEGWEAGRGDANVDQRTG